MAEALGETGTSFIAAASGWRECYFKGNLAFARRDWVEGPPAEAAMEARRIGNIYWRLYKLKYALLTQRRVGVDDDGNDVFEYWATRTRLRHD